MPAAWCLADPKIGEREVAGELLAHAARTGSLRCVGQPGPARHLSCRRLPRQRLRAWMRLTQVQASQVARNDHALSGRYVAGQRPGPWRV
jgi:hypothetical protein